MHTHRHTLTHSLTHTHLCSQSGRQQLTDLRLLLSDTNAPLSGRTWLRELGQSVSQSASQPARAARELTCCAAPLGEGTTLVLGGCVRARAAVKVSVTMFRYFPPPAVSERIAGLPFCCRGGLAIRSVCILLKYFTVA